MLSSGLERSDKKKKQNKKAAEAAFVA